jgi:hypothetical protein
VIKEVMHMVLNNPVTEEALFATFGKRSSKLLAELGGVTEGVLAHYFAAHDLAHHSL